MNVMSFRVEIIECWAIVFCAIIEQNASITYHSATGSTIVWIEQMNPFASGIEVGVQSDSFLVQILEVAGIIDAVPDPMKGVRTGHTGSGVRIRRASIIFIVQVKITA